jgi:UDP-N-acetylglucosamine 4-epimerase
MSLNQMLGHIRDFTENDTEVVYGPSRAGDVKHSQADIQKARDMMGYNPQVSAEMGLRLSVEWYRAIRKKA